MPSADIALRLALEGRREVASGLDDIKDGVTEAGDASERAGKKAEGGWTRTRGVLGKVAKGVLIAGTAIATGALAAGKVLYNIGAGFDDMSDTIRVGTGATGADLAALTDVAKQVGRDIPVAFADIGPTVADLNTRLGLTGPALEKLSKQFLEAGRITGQALDVNTMTSAFSAFGVEGKQTSKALDDIYRISQATGVGMNELASSVAKNAPNLKQFGFSLKDSAALLGTLDKAGLNGDKTLTSLSRAMVGFAKEGREPQKALYDTVGEIEKFIKAGDQAGAINMAAKVFGTKGAPQFVAALKSGKVDLENLMKATGASSDTILKAGEDTADFAEQWQLFKNRVLLKVEPVATKVFNAIGDGMTWITEDGIPALESFGHWLQENKKWILGLGIAVAALMAVTVAHQLVLAVSSGALARWLASTLLVKAATAAWAAVQWVLNAAMSANPIMLAVIAIAALVAGLVIAWKKSETFRAIVIGAFNAVKDSVVAAFSWIGEKATAVWDGITRGATKAKNWIVNKFEAVITFFTELPGRITEVATGMWDGLKDAFKTVLNSIIGLWNGIDFTISVSVPGWVPGIGGSGWTSPDIFPDIPLLARGGDVQAGKPYIVGDGGRPELFVPDQPGRVLPRVPDPVALDLGDNDRPWVAEGPAARARRGQVVRQPLILEMDGKQVATAMATYASDQAARA